MPKQSIEYAYLDPEVSDPFVLDAFRDCSKEATSVTHFRQLIASTLGEFKNYQIFGDQGSALDRLSRGGHLYLIQSDRPIPNSPKTPANPEEIEFYHD